MRHLAKKAAAVLTAVLILTMNVCILYAQPVKADTGDSQQKQENPYTVRIITGEEARALYYEDHPKRGFVIGNTAVWEFAYEGKPCARVYAVYEFEYSDGLYVQMASTPVLSSKVLVGGIVDKITDLKVQPSSGFSSGFTFTYSIKSNWSFVWTTSKHGITCDTYGELDMW